MNQPMTEPAADAAALGRQQFEALITEMRDVRDTDPGVASQCISWADQLSALLAAHETQAATVAGLRAELETVNTEIENIAINLYAYWVDCVPSTLALIEAFISRHIDATVVELRGYSDKWTKGESGRAEPAP